MATTRREWLRNALLAGGPLSLHSIPVTAAQVGDRPIASLADFGGLPDDPRFDNGPPFNAALQHGVSRLYIPRGSWHFLTRPDAITYPLEITGDGFGCSSLVRRYAPRTQDEGLLTVQAGACQIRRVCVCAGGNTSGAAGIALIGSAQSSPDYSVIEDVYVSVEPGSSANWSDALVIDGTARTTAPIGVRDISIRNCHLFASTNSACRISGAVGVSIHGGGFYPAGGSIGRLLVAGSNAVYSHYITVDIGHIGGLSLENCRYVSVKAAIIAGDITGANSAENVLIMCRCTGTVQTEFSAGLFIDPSRGISAPAQASTATTNTPAPAQRNRNYGPFSRG